MFIYLLGSMLAQKDSGMGRMVETEKGETGFGGKIVFEILQNSDCMEKKIGSKCRNMKMGRHFSWVNSLVLGKFQLDFTMRVRLHFEGLLSNEFI